MIIPASFGVEPFFSIDPGGLIIAANYSAEKITSLSHDLINSSFTDLFKDPAKAAEMLDITLTKGKVDDFPLSFYPGNKGKGTDALFNAFYDEKAERISAIGTIISTTGKSGEESLQKIQKEITDYKYALDESSIVAITDQKGIIMYVNRNFCKISKYSKEELIGQDHRIINSGYHPKEFIRNLWVTIAKGKIWKGELKNRAKDGTYYWVDTTIIPFLNEEKKPYQYIAIRADITERKRAEEEVIKAYKENETVLNRINDGVVSVDNNWRYTFINDAALSTHPLSREEILGKVIWDVHPGMKGTIFWDKYHEAMQTRKVVEIDDHYAPMNIWFSVKVYPSADGLTIFYKDVTASKIAEQKLSQTLKEVTDYKLALDEANIVAITDQKGIITHANDNFCKISKYSREELIGQDHRIINSGHHSKEFIRDLWVTIANGKIWRGELKNKAKDGTIYWVDTTIVPFLNEEEKPYQYVAIRADITERKKIEENLEQSLKEITDYKYALDESSIIAITDQKGIIGHANHNFCKISKYSLDELIGQDHRIINSGYHSKEFIRNLWITIANGKIWRGELKNKAKDGTFYWVDTTIVPFLNEQGKPYQYVAIRADITQRKKAEEDILILNEELEKRVKERTEEIESFSYSVSHDLRAPLRAVNGYAQILKEDYNDLFDAEGKRLLGEVQANANKMGILIDDLLAFSRLGRKEVERSVIDMNMLTEVAVREISQTTAHHAEIKLSSLLPVSADHALLQNVMINLISNAVKYSGKKEKPLIEIKSKRDGDEIMYSISDNGVGFDMTYVDKLFGVFQRLHSTDEFPGTGVGLAIVKRIIDKHKGRIWAESKIGTGTTFFFTLPEN